MKKSTNAERICAMCGKHFPCRLLTPFDVLHIDMTKNLHQDYPNLNSESYICQQDLIRLRTDYVHSLLESEKGELNDLENMVVQSIKDQDLLSATLDTQSLKKMTFGERLTDKIATFGGSWRFITLFGIFLFGWMSVNSIMLWLEPLDPYPYIFLNLLLSCLAAIQAPLIMMSQNRQEARDRVRAQNDYQINLKAELEIRNLHEKMDHLLIHQWEKMVKIQEIQLEILAEITAKKKSKK
jgi:uncharacterized membrane protein